MTPLERATKPYYEALFDIVKMLTTKAQAGSIEAARELRLMILEAKSDETPTDEPESDTIKSALTWTQPLESLRVGPEPPHRM
ncbi:MAG: hypothetical protein J3T61_01275 [Candidatus Brocadiales bacterium]|nr:hypothetical protein [Candidatus Bathyanammoxibius sp.]